MIDERYSTEVLEALNRGEDIITRIRGWGTTPGHWHWHINSYGVPDIRMNPPHPGRHIWNCQCPAEPTHECINTRWGSAPGNRLTPAHRSW